MWVVEFLYRGGASEFKGPFKNKQLAEEYAKNHQSCPGDSPAIFAREIDNMAGFEKDWWDLTWPEVK